MINHKIKILKRIRIYFVTYILLNFGIRRIHRKVSAILNIIISNQNKQIIVRLNQHHIMSYDYLLSKMKKIDFLLKFINIMNNI